MDDLTFSAGVSTLLVYSVRCRLVYIWNLPCSPSSLASSVEQKIRVDWSFFQPSSSTSIYLKRKEKGFWLGVNNTFRHLWGRNKTRWENLMAVNLCVTQRESDGKKKGRYEVKYCADDFFFCSSLGQFRHFHQ